MWVVLFKLDKLMFVGIVMIVFVIMNVVKMIFYIVLG